MTKAELKKIVWQLDTEHPGCVKSACGKYQSIRPEGKRSWYVCGTELVQGKGYAVLAGPFRTMTAFGVSSAMARQAQDAEDTAWAKEMIKRAKAAHAQGKEFTIKLDIPC